MINSFFYRVLCALEAADAFMETESRQSIVISLTFNLQAIEDIYSDSVDLQLTGTLLPNLIQD